jgi:hypothetical protein
MKIIKKTNIQLETLIIESEEYPTKKFTFNFQKYKEKNYSDWKIKSISLTSETSPFYQYIVILEKEIIA